MKDSITLRERLSIWAGRKDYAKGSFFSSTNSHHLIFLVVFRFRILLLTKQRFRVKRVIYDWKVSPKAFDTQLYIWLSYSVTFTHTFAIMIFYPLFLLLIFFICSAVALSVFIYGKFMQVSHLTMLFKFIIHTCTFQMLLCILLVSLFPISPLFYL